jgi:hypothetical protein
MEYFRIIIGGMPGVSVRYAVWDGEDWVIDARDDANSYPDGTILGMAKDVAIWLHGGPAGTGICYQVHVAWAGWLSEVCDGQWAANRSNWWYEIQALRIRLYGQPTIPPMEIPPAKMPYDSAKAAEEQALRDNPPPWDSSDAYSGDNSQSPVETVRQPLTMMDGKGTITLFHHEEEETWGGNLWAAGYHLKAFAKTNRDNWTANSSTHGYLNTWGKILGRSFPAFTATMVANTINNPNSKWAGIWYSFYLFGNKVREETVGGGVYNVQKKIFEFRDKVTPEWKQTFWVGPIPAAVGAYGSAEAFIALGGKFWIDELDGTIEPSGALWVTTYGAVGVEGAVAAKVKGEISLLQAAVPVHAKITWMFGVNDGGQCDAAVTASAKASATLKQLSGRLAACVDFFGEFCEGIGGYDGFEQTINLFDVSMTEGLAFGRCGDGMTPAPPQI